MDNLFIDTEKVRDLYNHMTDIWPKSDVWYNYTHSQIIRYIKDFISSNICNKDDKIINIGSAGNEYNFPGNHFHVDIAEERIKHCARHFVATAEKLPFPNNFFDRGLCVGSVINYCDPMLVISEISRVLKPNGTLILDFEQSRSYQFIGKSYNTSAQLIESFNSGNKDIIWVFSERHIISMCRTYGLEVSKLKYFHLFTPLVYRICKKEGFAAKFCFMDKFLNKIPHLKKISCNIILTVHKPLKI